MSVLEDSDTEIGKAFDERVRLRRRKVLSNITNTSTDAETKQHKRNGNVFFEALHGPTQHYSRGDIQKTSTNTKSDRGSLSGNGRSISLEAVESPVKDRISGLKKTMDADTHAADITDSRWEGHSAWKNGVELSRLNGEDNRKKVVFKDAASDKDGKEFCSIDGVEANAGLVESQNADGRVKNSEGMAGAKRHQGHLEHKEMEDQKSVLSRIQNELEELKEAHRRALRVKSKLIKVMEKEVAELKQGLEAKKEEEIESFKKQYDRMFIEKREAYKKAFKQKILEYKNALDEVYKKKATEYQGKCNDVISRLKELYKGNKSRDLHR